MNTKTITEIIHRAKMLYVEKLKGKYWKKFSMELAKRIPEEFKEDWEEHGYTIKKALEKISKESKAVVFKDDKGVFRVAASVNWVYDPMYPNDGRKSCMITYYSGVGEMREIKTKFLTPVNKDWILIYNDELNYEGQPIADISFQNINDSFSLGALSEYGANVYFLSTTAKGIIELMRNSKNKDINEETLTQAILNGVFINNAAMASQGTDAYAKVVASNKLTSSDNLNLVTMVNASDYKTHLENLVQAENEFFADKGLKDFKKNGTYNAHTEEIKGMQEDKVGGIFEKIIHIEKNIAKILLLVAGREIAFKFDLEDPKPQTLPNNNQPDPKEPTNNDE